MKKYRVITTVAGVLLFLSIILTFVWFNSSKNSDQPTEIVLDAAVSKIQRREIKEAAFKQSQVEFTDVNNKKYYADLGSDPTRESLVRKINEYNNANTSSPIKLMEEPTSSGWGWIILFNAVPFFMFFIMWAATLAVIVYAVRTLSRNKS